MKFQKLLLLGILSMVWAAQTSPLLATNYTVNSNTTDNSAKTLATNDTLTVQTNGTLSLGSTTIPVTVSGNSTITNNGQILQTGTGRGIVIASGTPTLTITNNAGALIRTADADTLRITPTTTGGAALNNYGSIISLNASKGGSQAVDWSNITSGSNVITNYSTGLIKATDADSVRPGINGVIYNYGTIQSVVTTDTGSDAIDAQNNSGVTVYNYSTGLIDSSRHGITGGAKTSLVTFTTTISNDAGGIIRGNNGSGINLDGFNANQTATITNAGTITGNGVTGDGDGLDVDGLVNVTNTGIIRSVNAFSATGSGLAYSEGITVGGGTITNSGTIEGLVASGNTNAVGRGISLLGNDVTVGDLIGTREAIYGNATVTNQSGGLIRGQSDSGIIVDGPRSGHTVTINNNAGATIQGGGAAGGNAANNAAIQTANDDDTITNAGTIDGSSNGKAINLGAGTNVLNITGGSAVINGDISGGTAYAGQTIGATTIPAVSKNSTLNITPGTGNTFSYSGAITNFDATNVNAGKFTLSGSITGGTITINSGGLFNYTGSSALTNNVTVNGGEFKNNGGNFTGTLTLASGKVSGSNLSGVALTIGSGSTLSPGNSPGTLSTASETWGSGGRYIWEINAITGSQGANPGWDFADITGSLTISATSSSHFTIELDSLIGSSTLGALSGLIDNQTYVFTIATASDGIFGFSADAFTLDTTNFNDGVHNSGRLSIQQSTDGKSIQLVYTVPEPSTWAMLVGGLIGLVVLVRRRRLQSA